MFKGGGGMDSQPVPNPDDDCRICTMKKKKTVPLPSPKWLIIIKDTTSMKNNVLYLSFKQETAEKLIKREFVALRESFTVNEAITHLRVNVKGKTNIHYLY